jgi:hypothetical protein
MIKIGNLVQLDDALSIRIGRSAVTLTPTQAFALAEQLAQKSLRRAMIDEVERKPLKPRATMQPKNA